MKFPQKDGFVEVPPGTSPPYNNRNPLLAVVEETARIRSFLAAGLHCYEGDSLQFLLPLHSLSLYGPSGDQFQVSAPLLQDNKNDFQKQNIAAIIFAPFFIVRGYVKAGDWIGCFLKIGYRGSPDSPLVQRSGGSAGEFLDIRLKIGTSEAGDLIRLPYNSRSECYETELWGYGASDLDQRLDQQGRRARADGFIQQRPDLIKGSALDFRGPIVDSLRDNLNRKREAWQILDQAPGHLLHPLLPLMIAITFANEKHDQWEPEIGKFYEVEFGMAMRGWQSFLGCGISGNPHGGVGFLEYRNLFSNYFGYESKREQTAKSDWKNELGRDLVPGQHDSGTWKPGSITPGEKLTSPKRETFMSVDYMDLHILQPECGIGIHRHRDNQEAFLMLNGRGLMLMGNWLEEESHLRAFELRTMQPGDISLCKTGQLHALYNVTDEECHLFMFGGYD